LYERKTPGLYNVDTRAITRIVREHGVMNARLSKTPTLTQQEQEKLKGYIIQGSVEATSCKTAYAQGDTGAKYHVALWDFGAKANIANELVTRGCRVTVLPCGTTAQEIAALNPDGIMLSNGPGDPADNVGIIAEIKKAQALGIPMFGICLGHQLMALANGAKTQKLHYGHRGANQPVVDPDGRAYITSQNHGYAVLADTLPSYARERFYNGNDRSNEGVTYEGFPAFSVQFHPEAAAGPLDTGFLFDEFIAMIETHKGGRPHAAE
jgi:carbamoyl-phosphate synthase small subunit